MVHLIADIISIITDARKDGLENFEYLKPDKITVLYSN